jgi:restriction system protein
MSIPDYQTLMRPLLKLVADGNEHSFPSIVEALTVDYKLTDSERRELLPSGSQFLFANRVGWARTYLKKGGTAVSPKTRRGPNNGSRPESLTGKSEARR